MIRRRAKVARLGLVAVLLGALAASAAPTQAAEVGPYPGALPDTPSATTVTGRGEFSDLSIKVNQTADLTTQAVSVTWSWPGRSTLTGVGGPYQNAYDANVLRIMQCWGDPVTAAAPGNAVEQANYIAADPGPAREHCEYGGSLTTQQNVTQGNQQNRTANSYTTGTPTSYGQETAYPPKDGFDSDVPFIAANGTVEPHQTKVDPSGISVYSNEFFDQFSTNESPANYTFGPDGRGGVQFQVQNSTDSRGLGCGAAKTGGTGLNRCWLVIVPQGTKDYDGSDLLLRPRGGIYKTSAYSSPLVSTNWSNRIVVPLNFLPSISACTSGGNSYETLGSPLVSNAMLSWQAALCGTKGTIYNYSVGTDQRSRDSLATGTTSMQFVSDPVPQGTASSPITYAPLTLSGLGIAFVWDAATQNTRTFVSSPGLPLPTIKLNQRLVAKLLTYSYQAGNPARISPNSAQNDPPITEYAWLTKNPTWLGADPEFLALNPGLTQLPKNVVLLQSKPTIATLQGPLNGSDAIHRLWQWVMSDNSARTFMAGVADPFGMTVDPYYSTNPDINPSGAAFDTDIDSLPYADPWKGKPGNPEPKCDAQTFLAMTDIWPAARDLTTVAKDILTVNPLEKYTGSFNCPGTPEVDVNNPVGWKTSRTGVVVAGQRQLAGLTDTASGAQFGVTYASLPNAAGNHVQPNAASITAAASDLRDTGVPGVQQPDLASKVAGAYPLSLIGYAGVTTQGTPADACVAYADLLAYAAGDGQRSGTSIGDLPPGYVPLSATLRAQTAAAAKTVARCAQAPVPTASPANDTPVDTGSGEGAVVPADNAPVDTGATTAVTSPSAATTQPPSLAAASRTKPDPTVFAYVVPIALGVGVLALLAAPLAGLRRRRPGAPPGP